MMHGETQKPSRNEIRETFRELGQRRGKENERFFQQALEQAIENGNAPEWLIGFVPATSEEEEKGIDGWIETSDVGNISFQLKSSKSGQIYAEGKHPRIPVLVIRPGSSEAEILEVIQEVIGAQREKYLQQRGMNF